MTPANILLDPTAELSAAVRQRLVPSSTFEGKRVGLLDIGKMRGDEFIDRLEVLLVNHGAVVRRYKKPTNVKVAPQALVQQIVAECDLIVEALADCGSCTSCAIHDVNSLDKLGIPGGLIATVEFEQAAKAQSEALGFDPAIVWVPHPIQNRTTEELHEFADKYFENILDLIRVGGNA